MVFRITSAKGICSWCREWKENMEGRKLTPKKSGEETDRKVKKKKVKKPRLRGCYTSHTAIQDVRIKKVYGDQ